jgi:hypothetical protein
MSMDIEQIAAAFCSHKFASTYPYMADPIKWTVIGREELIGRDAVIAKCEQAAQFLATVTSTITKLKVYRAEPLVFVEGSAEFQDAQDQRSRVASCDIFRFSDGRLVEITSYLVDINKP